MCLLFKEKGIQILKYVLELEAPKVSNIHIKAFEDKRKRTQAPLKRNQKLYEGESSIASIPFFKDEKKEGL